MAHATNRLLAALVLLILALSGCVTTGSMRAGQHAEQLEEYDRAIVEYTKVLRAHPDDRQARRALERAKLRSSLDHYTRGRRLLNGGRLEEALVELQVAAELNPNSDDIDTTLRDVRAQVRNRIAVARGGKTELQTLIERSRDLPPPGLDLPTDARLPQSVIFRDAGSRDVYTALARLANITLIFDPQFRDQPITIDLRSTTLANALDSISTATHNFYRVTGPRTVTVIPDTPAKRREYEEEVVRTFYLSNADLKETVDLLRVVIDARRIAPLAATNAITIKDTPDRIAAASRVISAIDKARPEVVIDVELLEIARSRLLEYGLQFASAGSPGINGSAQAGANDGTFSLRDLTHLTQSDVFLAGVPALYYRLLKQDTNTRVLANPQLRTSEGLPAQARFGERVPVPVTTFAPIATGGVAQQPITSFNYENIGVNIDITPRTHHDDEVSLALNIEVSSISGTGFGGLPTFGNRAIRTTIRLHDGETNLLAGLIRDDERNLLEGVPGLSDLPILGRLFAHSRKETQETDIVLTLTPHIIRVLDLNESDLRAFRVGREDSGGGVIELPVPPELPPRDTPAQERTLPQPQAPEPQQPAQQPPSPGITPIVPPPQTPAR
jgi:general secretion pathway protein D